jgi:Zn-dependent protease
LTHWSEPFAGYQISLLGREEVVQGTLLPGLDPDREPARRALASWRGPHYVDRSSGETRVTLIRRLAPRTPGRPWLHALLLLATLATTTASGALLRGREAVIVAWRAIGPVALPLPVGLAPDALTSGLPFSLPLLAILFAHEMGHYAAAQRHRMDVSIPYFIPAPHWLNLVGTFGAFIRLRSAIVNRAVLLEVGAAGPLAGFALALPAAALGLAWSTGVEAPPGGSPAPFAVFFGDLPVWLGGSLAFHALNALAGPPGTVVLLHPLAFAAWLGFFVTALNLFPLAQLDGGHIVYALGERLQRPVAWLFLAMLGALGTLWLGWWVWTGLILLLGRGRIAHPAVWDARAPLSPGGRVVGWICVALFLLTFVPVPLQA